MTAATQAVQQAAAYHVRVVFRDGVERYLCTRGGRLGVTDDGGHCYASIASARRAMENYLRQWPKWSYYSDIIDANDPERSVA